MVLTACYPAPSADDCTDADLDLLVQEQLSSATASCQYCLSTQDEADPNGFSSHGPNGRVASQNSKTTARLPTLVWQCRVTNTLNR